MSAAITKLPADMPRKSLGTAAARANKGRDEGSPRAEGIVNAPTPAFDLGNQLMPLLQLQVDEIDRLLQHDALAAPLALQPRNQLR